MKKIKISSLPNFEDFKKESLKDPEIKREYDKLGPEFELINKNVNVKCKYRTNCQQKLKMQLQKNKYFLMQIRDNEKNCIVCSVCRMVVLSGYGKQQDSCLS